MSRFRVVAIDGRTQRDGKFLEVLGTYNPQATPKQFTMNSERIAFWIEKGAEVRKPFTTFSSRTGISRRWRGRRRAWASRP